jgi:hypothetical protein
MEATVLQRKPAGIDYFSQLPVELKNQILSMLDAKDRVLLRLMSREIASLLAETMFEDGLFAVRPHLDDMTRLRAVSRHPIISKGVKHIKFFLGDVCSISFI